MISKYFLFFTLFLTILSCKTSKIEYQYIQGSALGTTFNIKYDSPTKKDYNTSVDSIFTLINTSLSTYHPNSLISRINNNDSLVKVDYHFRVVYKKARRIFEETKGAFDPTVGPLVNAWGFGPKKPIIILDSTKINDLMQYIGFDKVKLENQRIIKEYPEIYIDFNAIAKGYTVDVISNFLESQYIDNYMVEIGGEVRVRGNNPDGKLWKIGIEKPLMDGQRALETSVSLQDKSMATSGNYRKFKIDKNGKKYVHTINPKTGFTAQNNLLSATVVSTLDCADVDAYATAFMVMGYKKTKQFIENQQKLQVFLIFSDVSGNISTFNSIVD